MKCEGPNSYQSKDTAYVKVFVNKQTNKWTNARTNRQMDRPKTIRLPSIDAGA